MGWPSKKDVLQLVTVVRSRGGVIVDVSGRTVVIAGASVVEGTSNEEVSVVEGTLVVERASAVEGASVEGTLVVTGASVVEGGSVEGGSRVEDASVDAVAGMSVASTTANGVEETPGLDDERVMGFTA